MAAALPSVRGCPCTNPDEEQFPALVFYGGLPVLKTLHCVKHILNEEECRSVGKAGVYWYDELAVVIVVKGAVQETLGVLEENKRDLWLDRADKTIKMLSELYQEKLVTEDEVKRMKGEGGDLSARVVIVQCTKPPKVVARTVNLLDKYRHIEEARWLRVLSELYQEKLVTEDEVKRMKGERGSLSARVVLVQFTKPPEVVARTVNMLDKYGCNVEANQLRALNELFTRHLLTAEECSEVARKRWWEDHLNQVLLTKPAEVVQAACQVLEKHGCRVEEELKMLSELYQKLVTEDEVKRMKGEGGDLSYRVVVVQCTKPPDVVAKTAIVLDKYGHNVEASLLRVLSELYQEKLVTEDEVKRMREQGGNLSERVVVVQCTKPPEVVARTTNVLDKYRHNRKASLLRALNELFTRHLLTAEECFEVARMERWEDHLNQVLLTKPAEVVQEACQVLEKHGLLVKKELKMLSELYQEKLVTEDEVKRMKGEGGYLSDRVVLIQCTKPPEVVARTVNMLDKYGHNEEARRMRVLNELFTRHLLTAEECSEVVGKERWEEHLNQVLLTKPAEVVEEACQVLETHGWPVEKLKTLNEIFTRHLLTAEECSEVAGKERWEWDDHLTQILLTKPAEVVKEACQVLEKHGLLVKKKLKMLSELYQEKLVTEDEVKRMKEQGGYLPDRVVIVQFTKPPEVVTKTSNVLDKYGHNVEARWLRVLSELYQEKLVTEDEVKRMKEEGGLLSDRVVIVQCTKPPEVVARTVIVLDKYGHNEEASLLRVLNELFTRHLLTAEECSELARKGRKPEPYLLSLFFMESLTWEDHLIPVLLTKPVEVVQEACQVLEKHGCRVEEKLKMLLELYQEKLVTDDEVKRMKEQGGDLSDRVVIVQCTKPPEVVARTTNVLDKYRHNEEARRLRVLNELFTRHLLTAEECSEEARERWEWEHHLVQVLSTKPAEVVQEACQVLKKHGCPAKKLKTASLYQGYDSFDDAGGDSGSDMSYDSIGSHSSFTEYKRRLPRRRRFKVQPSSSQTHGAASDSDSDSDSNKALSVSSEDSHHSCGVPSPTPMGPEEEASAVESPCNPELGMEPVLIESPDEALLKELCYMATGIQQFHVGPGGGTFSLGCGDATLNVPPGALKKETSVHFAIILHGPFVFSIGCRPGSVVVYVNMDGATLVKPVCLNLSHWCSREEEGGNTLKFIRAPHVPDAQMKYFFEELEEGDFTTHTNVGMLTISEPQCLYCVEMKSEGVARYNALTFQKNGTSASTLFFRIQLMCDSKEWNKTVEGALQKNGWSSCSSDVATFSFAAEESDQKRTIAACPVDAKGPGWICRIEGHQLISEDLFLKLKNITHEELEGEVNSGRFPPYVHYKLRYTSPEERRPQPSLMMVDLKGTNENLKLSFDIMEEASSETPSSAHPPIGTCQTAPTSKKAQATSTASEFSVLEFLKKHETEFFEVVDPRLSLLKLLRKGVITEDVRLSIYTSNTDDAREVLYHHLAHHANADTLKEYLRVAIAADGYPKMQSLGRKIMEELEQGGEQTH